MRRITPATVALQGFSDLLGHNLGGPTDIENMRVSIE
jgi:hypothetical protein